ncbi:MAG: hypothetical protein ABIF08_02330 [Nanoarchaeota archaeon]
MSLDIINEKELQRSLFEYGPKRYYLRDEIPMPKISDSAKGNESIVYKAWSNILDFCQRNIGYIPDGIEDVEITFEPLKKYYTEMVWEPLIRGYDKWIRVPAMRVLGLFNIENEDVHVDPNAPNPEATLFHEFYHWLQKKTGEMGYLMDKLGDYARVPIEMKTELATQIYYPNRKGFYLD